MPIDLGSVRYLFAGPFLAQLVALVITIFWLWMLVDCLRNPRLGAGGKLLWAACIVFFNWPGALCYLFLGRSRSPGRSRSSPRFQYYRARRRQPTQYYYPSRQSAVYQQHTASQTPSRGYQQGYQAQPSRPVPSSAWREELRPDWEQYEQPQAQYPEMPPQQSS